MTKTQLVVRDTETSSAFEPYTGNVPSDNPSYVLYKKKVLDASPAVKLAASKVLVVSPEQLAALGRIFHHKSPAKSFAKTATSVDSFLATLDVLKYDGKFEVTMRACVDKSFLKGVVDSQEMLKGDLSKMRRLPAGCLVALRDLIETKDIDTTCLASGGKKLLKEALASVDENGDTDDATCRVDFSAFKVVEGKRNLPTAAKLAVSKVLAKRKREEVDANKDELSQMVKFTRLPSGQVAFTFDSATSICVAGKTVVVDLPQVTEADEEAAEDEEEE